MGVLSLGGRVKERRKTAGPPAAFPSDVKGILDTDMLAIAKSRVVALKAYVYVTRTATVVLLAASVNGMLGKLTS